MYSSITSHPQQFHRVTLEPWRNVKLLGVCRSLCHTTPRTCKETMRILNILSGIAVLFTTLALGHLLHHHFINASSEDFRSAAFLSSFAAAVMVGISPSSEHAYCSDAAAKIRDAPITPTGKRSPQPQITRASAPPPKAPPEDRGRWEPNCLQHLPKRTPARHWCRNTRRTCLRSRQPWHLARR
jgi:hypothetical protein